MSNLIISGASDDLVEIDGLIRDEFNVYGPVTVTIKVDDAVHLIATAEYDRDDDGEWRIEVAGNFPRLPDDYMPPPGVTGIKYSINVGSLPSLDVSEVREVLLTA